MDIHTPYGIGIGSALLGGITQQGMETGTEVHSEATSGAVYPTIQSITAQKPVVNFSTYAVAAALDLVALAGQNIADLAGSKLALYAQAAQHGGSRKTGSNHRKVVINDGLLSLGSLSVDHQGNAVLALLATVTYDGSNDPLVVTDSQALPGSLTDAERFTLGSATTLESLSIGQITSLNIDLGIEVRSEGADSNLWDTLAYIVSIKPVITLRGTQLNWLGAAKIPLIGKAITHANTSIYLRKREQGGSFVADGTAEHIKLTVDGVATIPTPWDGSADAPNEIEMRIDCRNDGSNDPIVIDTTSAIT